MKTATISVSLLILLLTVGAFGQPKKVISNKSPAHQLLNDTKSYIIPPPEFQLTANMLAYVSPSTGANFGVSHIHKDIAATIEHLSKAYFQKKDYEIIEIKKFKINKLKAVWYELEHVFYDRVNTKYILLVGNHQEHDMIEAYCPKSLTKVRAELKKSLLTAYYDLDSSHIKQAIHQPR